MNDGWWLKDVALGSGVGLRWGRVQREKGFRGGWWKINYNREFWSIKLIEKIRVL